MSLNDPFPIVDRGEMLRIARRVVRVKMSLADARAWSQGVRIGWAVDRWFQARSWVWRQVKPRAMEEEVKARSAGQSWAEAWTRKEAQMWARAIKGQRGMGEEAWALAWVLEEGPAWTEERAEALVEATEQEVWEEVWEELQARVGARATEKEAWEEDWPELQGRAGVEMWGEAAAVAEAMALAGVWIWARSEVRGRGEKAPPGLADSATIWRILSDFRLHRSPETRDEYSCIIHFIAPITLLPVELLRQIFLIIVDEAGGPPVVLRLVCKPWHAIVAGMWAPLNLGTTTPKYAVTSKLERSQWLDIVVNTNLDRSRFTPSRPDFESIFAAMEASSRWRSLVVKSFPAQADLPEDLVDRCLQRCPNATMSHFTTFKIKSTCDPSPLLDRLLRILGTTASSALTTVEIHSANVISFLAPAHPSMFRSVKVLILDTPGIPNPVDLLPHLPQLETFIASHISFPSYHNDVNLPLIHTLRLLRLRAVSVQWMSGRTFHILTHCTLILPRHHHVLHTLSVSLPNCTHLTFQGYPFNILNIISAHKLSRLSVTSSSSCTRRGSQQLLQLSRHVLGDSRLAPRILHIGLEATNQAWIAALSFMPELEELVIECARPSSLGAKVIRSLIVEPLHASNPDTLSTRRELYTPLFPLLKRLGLKYRRWLRPSEHFDLIPDLESVISSREHSNYSLQRFSIWLTSKQKDPLELIEESQMNRIALEHLANQVGSKGLGSRHGETGEDGSSVSVRVLTGSSRAPLCRVPGAI